MTFTLTCLNGKKIDMTEYILKQMKGELTRQEVQTIINNYKRENLD